MLVGAGLTMIVPADDHPHATRPRWHAWIGRFIARLLGWDFVEPFPTDKKMVVLSGPHTSNWDFLFMSCAALIYRAEIRAMAKASAFRFPMGPLVRSIGALPIDRSGAHGVVDQMVQLFNSSERLLLVIPASGTRSKRPYWRSGFYWVAHQAQVPLALSYLDYENKRAGILCTLRTTGDIHADMERIRQAYAHIRGKYPENRSEIRLKEEDAEP
ncbi:MAG: 1-acyl-sn-glycerol-3-phosphate acyltransferase [Myxococcota bacterium]